MGQANLIFQAVGLAYQLSDPADLVPNYATVSHCAQTVKTSAHYSFLVLLVVYNQPYRWGNGTAVYI